MNPTLTESQSKHFRELLRSASARRTSGEYVVEGPHLLEAAIEKAAKNIILVAFTEEAGNRYPDLITDCHRERLKTFSIPAKLASRISDTEEPQGIFAVLTIPKSGAQIEGDVVLALDGVQDPGNAGNIIRTAA